MKLLLIHSDYIEYEVKEKAIKTPEETKIKKDRFEEALTAFTAVEKVDEKSSQQAVKQAAAEIEKTAEQLKVKNIMLYPYAHLSSDLASPKKAQEILIEIEHELKNKNFNVSLYLTSEPGLESAWAKYEEISQSHRSRAGLIEISSESITEFTEKFKTLKDIANELATESAIAFSDAAAALVAIGAETGAGGGGRPAVASAAVALAVTRRLLPPPPPPPPPRRLTPRTAACR